MDSLSDARVDDLGDEIGRPNVVRAILSFQPDVGARDFTRRTALERARAAGHSEVVEMLRAYIADRQSLRR
jgi:ankyrin repeat protein